MGMILDKLGIAVRTGQHCAEPVMTHYGVTGMCRASFAMYNTLAEADALVAGVERARRCLNSKDMLIVLEGLDGAGKSTQVELVRRMFAQEGWRAIFSIFRVSTRRCTAS